MRPAGVLLRLAHQGNREPSNSKKNGLIAKTNYRRLLVLLLCAVPRLFADGPEFRSVRIPRVPSPPHLEDFLSMEPAPAWHGKLANVDGLIPRVPTDGAPTAQRTA